MNIHQIIEQHWQEPNPILSVILRPFTQIFSYVSQKRRQKYLSGSLKIKKLPIPVIIVGNIHVGGTGKTPITTKIVKDLQAKGVKIGIISRGYGRKMRHIHILQPNSTAEQAGDEPLMLYRHTNAPTAVGSNRYETGLALLAQYPDLQIIISDDGLQHYALARDLEIVVFPAADIQRNHLTLLPNGCLREPLFRLNEADFIILSNSNKDKIDFPIIRQPEKIFHSQIHLGIPYRFNQSNDKLLASELQPYHTCSAIAGIARPERFFNALKQIGFHLKQTYILPDHETIELSDLPQTDYIFVTEKDAVKLPSYTPNNVWVLPIDVTISPDLTNAILTKIAI